MTICLIGATLSVDKERAVSGWMKEREREGGRKDLKGEGTLQLLFLACVSYLEWAAQLICMQVYTASDQDHVH